MKIEEGLPPPLGATWNGNGTNFALFWAKATKVDVCRFDSFDGQETKRVELNAFREAYKVTRRSFLALLLEEAGPAA